MTSPNPIPESRGTADSAGQQGRIGTIEGGLTAPEVAERIVRGQVNTSEDTASRSLAQILRANVLTRFNAILGSLMVVVVIVGPLQDGLFGVVLAVNTLVGVGQELRAKRTLNRLAVLTAPSAHALRDGRLVELAADAVVLDDILELRPGDQIVVDGLVLVADGLEIDESLLSGEAIPVVKVLGDEVRSGSYVVAGSGRIQAVRVGADAFAQKMQGEARRFSLVRSELQQGTNRILRMVTWVMIPAGVLLVTSQVIRSGQSVDEALRASVAGVGAMVPEGLVLLTTVAFALGAIRLARRRVLVQELAAIEGLARVDVLCIDKTGTLTEAGMKLGSIETLGDPLAEEALGALVSIDPSSNATLQALAALPVRSGWKAEVRVPFSSVRKWSAAQFSGFGTWVLGAPDVVMPGGGLPATLLARIETFVVRGDRVLLVAHTSEPLTGDVLPAGLEPACLVLLEERIRVDAADTIAYLVSQGIEIKVLSGDDPRTVSSIARRVGIPGATSPVDARELPEDPIALAEVLRGSSIFGRVQPHQKRAIVSALQASGHVVAMTGDGVNDVPALKQADLGIAMGSGTQATRAVGQIVLLESSFATIPGILGEGRRVINNVQRVANLFVTKTVYAAILAVVVGISAIPFPFYPRHLTIVSTLTIGVPGFFLALSSGSPRAQPGFIRRVLVFTVPAGTVVATVTLLTYLLARGPAHATTAQARTAATLALVAVGLAVLALVARPLTRAKATLIGFMVGGAMLIWAVPFSRRVFSLEWPPTAALWATAGIIIVAIPLLWIFVAIGARFEYRLSPALLQ
jgi:cation-transporting ATPase E